ncbi:MAG: hypothetical protein ACFHXK_03190 [bacterium]
MQPFYDDLDNHLPHARNLAQASVPMGMLLAWCARMQLLSQSFLQAHAQLVLRVQVEEVLGSELLVAAGGRLERQYFSEKGRNFLDQHYPDYFDQFCAEFGDEPYLVKDTWDNYRRIAPVLTQALMGKAAQPKAGFFSRLTHFLRG